MIGVEDHQGPHVAEAEAHLLQHGVDPLTVELEVAVKLVPDLAGKGDACQRLTCCHSPSVTHIVKLLPVLRQYDG
jgi:hypothetical protein